MLGKTLSAVALALLAATPVNAACTLANIGGSWALYVAGTESGTGFWFKCTMAITAAGKITAGSCIQSDGQSTPVNGTVRLTVPAACSFNAALEFSKFTERGTLNLATMSLDKQTVVGDGTLPNEAITFTMLKVK